MSTAVIVVANHRTGSGCVASMLHTLGVSMLPTPQPTLNGDDRWEDQDFVNIHRKLFGEIVDGKYDPTAWRYPSFAYKPNLVEEYKHVLRVKSKQQLWGFKDPRTVFTLDFVLGLAFAMDIDVRLVWLRREINAIASSLQRRDTMWPTNNVAVARHQFDQWQRMYSRYRVSCPGADLNYSDMVENPTLAAHILGRIIEPHVATATRLKAAAALVKKPT